MSLERMNFSARDLNSFTGMSSQNSENTYKEMKPEKKFIQTKVEMREKNFFEQIYDKAHNKDEY